MLLEKGVYYSPDDRSGGAVGKEPINYQIDIGTSKALLSPEMQRYLVPTLRSGWESSRSIAIFGEPHQNADDQFGLYKGLEIFFQDNPELIKRTIFLAEGYPKDESISVQPLIDIDPYPTDNVIRQALKTFLVPGYIAYEWKYQRGIPIVGVEDPWLYKMCRTFLVKDELDPEAIFLTYKDVPYRAADFWFFSVTARNKSMAETLLEYMGNYDNPMLFIGGLHLHKMDEGRFSFLQRWSSAGMMGPFTLFSSDAGRSENTGIMELLYGNDIGFTFIQSPTIESSEEEDIYKELFSTQHGDDYFPLYLDDDNDPNYSAYIRWLLESEGADKSSPQSISPISISYEFRYRKLFPSLTSLQIKGVKSKISTTIRPSPIAASSYIYEWTEHRKSESPNWFGIDGGEVYEKLGRGTIWDEPPVSRGRSYEQLRGANIGGNYPIVDDINDYAATSMKTLDLTTSPYQDPSVLGSTVRGYVDGLSGFSGPQQRYLELGIPTGRATPLTS